MESETPESSQLNEVPNPSQQINTEMHQQPQTPYDYLRALKETMQMEYEKLLHNKAAYSKAVDIEMVMLYRVIEKKMLDFMEDLTNKKVK